MDLLQAADELKAITHHSMLVVHAWRSSDTESMNGLLSELDSEFERIGLCDVFIPHEN